MIKIIEIKSGPENRAFCKDCGNLAYFECICHEEGKVLLNPQSLENFKAEINGVQLSVTVAPNIIQTIGSSWQVSVWDLDGKRPGFQGIFRQFHGPAVSTTRQDLVDWLAEPVRVGGGGPDDIHIYRALIIRGVPFEAQALSCGSDKRLHKHGIRFFYSPDNVRVLLYDEESGPYSMSVSEVYYWKPSDVKQIRRRVEDRLRKSEACLVIDIAQQLGVSFSHKQ